MQKKIFTEEKISNKLLKKLNRYDYDKDKRFVNLFNKNIEDFVKKRFCTNINSFCRKNIVPFGSCMQT